MISIRKEFVNEFGKRITVTVLYEEGGVTLTVSGPDSTGEFVVTPMEADVLRETLNELEPSYRKDIQ